VEADALLNALLDADACAVPALDLPRIVRQARAVLCRSNVATATPDAGVRLSRSVGRWLRSRLHVSNEEIATAERILCGIGSLDAASERELGRLLAARNTDDVIRRAATLIGDGAASHQRTRAHSLRLLAVFVLEPPATPA
jgi:hypothetical protein